MEPTVHPAEQENEPLLDCRLLVVEPRDLVRHGVRLTMEKAGAEIVALVSTGARALELVAGLQPDMVILAARPPDMSGAEATRRIVAIAPRCQILVLGTEEEADLVLDALVEGGSGHLPTLGSPDQLVQRVRLARVGGVPLSQAVAGKLWKRLRAGPDDSLPPSLDTSSLTAREVDVLRLLPTGMENGDIARVLSISPTTVKRHVSSILEKLELDNRVQAAVRAVRRGIA